jgi:hypothetical protein
MLSLELRRGVQHNNNYYYCYPSQVQWLVPVIPANLEAEMRTIMVEGYLLRQSNFLLIDILSSHPTYRP